MTESLYWRYSGTIRALLILTCLQVLEGTLFCQVGDAAQTVAEMAGEIPIVTEDAPPPAPEADDSTGADLPPAVSSSTIMESGTSAPGATAADAAEAAEAAEAEQSPPNPFGQFTVLQWPGIGTDGAILHQPTPEARTALTAPKAIDLAIGTGAAAFRSSTSPWLPDRSEIYTKGGWNWGKVRVQPSVTLSGLYVNTDESNAQCGLIGLARLRLAGMLDASKTGEFGFVYEGLLTSSESDRRSDYNQSLFLWGRRTFSKLTLGGRLAIDALSGLDRDLGQRANRKLLTLVADAEYELTKKTSIATTLSIPIQKYDSGIGSAEIRLTNYLNYAISRKTLLGIGIRTGVLRTQEGDRDYYEQALARFEYAFDARIRTYGEVGGEWREFASGGTKTSPVFDVALEYRTPNDTSITVVCRQEWYASAALMREESQTTTLEAVFAGRIVERLYWGMDLGLESAQYTTLRTAATSGRRDFYWYATPSISWELKRGASLTLNCSYGENNSNVPSYSYKTSYVGLSWTFFF